MLCEVTITLPCFGTTAGLLAIIALDEAGIIVGKEVEYCLLTISKR